MSQELVYEAFQGKEASATCSALGALLAKDNSGFDIEDIAKRLNSDVSSVWLAISRLRHEIPVLESFPDYKNKEILPNGKVRIYYKYRVKAEFLTALSKLIEG